MEEKPQQQQPKRHDNDYIICVLSRRRPKNLLKPVYQNIEQPMVAWFVSDEQDFKDYRKINSDIPLVISGGLIETRNKMIDYAISENKKYVVMMDDDLTSIQVALDKTTKVKITLTESIAYMIDFLENQLRGQFYLAGVAPTPNLFFYNPDEPVSFTKFVIASIMIINTKTELRFDPNITLKEDYDFTLQNIKKYGGAVRFNNMLFSFGHFNNKGGVVDYRTAQLEQQNIRYLKDKWGYLIKDNPRRKNEILLNIPRKNKDV